MFGILNKKKPEKVASGVERGPEVLSDDSIWTDGIFGDEMTF